MILIDDTLEEVTVTAKISYWDKVRRKINDIKGNYSLDIVILAALWKPFYIYGNKENLTYEKDKISLNDKNKKHILLLIVGFIFIYLYKTRKI